MKVHFLQHVPFEGPANIAKWFLERGHTVEGTFLFQHASFPDPADVDFLVIMGGPMSVNDEAEYSWLAGEKRFVEKALRAGVPMLGVCLGAQIMASVLGCRVYKNHEKEIGWFPVRLTPEAGQSNIFKNVSEEFTAFHWHGETFDIPSDARHVAMSEGCANQAFEYEGRALGLQFHLESTPASVARLVENCGGDMTPGKYVQDAQTMTARLQNFRNATNVLDAVLSSMVDV